MDELYAKFLPQFVELARERLQRARAVSAQHEPPALTEAMRELHGIAGEAGLLGLTAVVPVARRAEDHARRLRDGRPDADPDGFAAALDELGDAIEALGAPAQKSGEA